MAAASLAQKELAAPPLSPIATACLSAGMVAERHCPAIAQWPALVCAIRAETRHPAPVPIAERGIPLCNRLLRLQRRGLEG